MGSGRLGHVAASAFSSIWDVREGGFVPLDAPVAQSDELIQIELLWRVAEQLLQSGDAERAVRGLRAPSDPDRLVAARRAVSERMLHALQPGLRMGAALSVMGEALSWLYAGEPGRGCELLDRAQLVPGRAQRLRRTSLAVVLHASCHGLCAAAALRREGKLASRSAELRQQIERCTRLLASFGGPACLSLAESLRAALALEAGLWLQASRHLASSLQLRTAANLTMSAAATSRRLGQLTGGVEGYRQAVNAEAKLRTLRVTNLEAMTELLCPGLRS